MLNYDYSRSFVQWSDSISHHTPRCAIHASCKLRDLTRGDDAQNNTREYFLTHPCMGEKMYAERDVIHVPTADFHMVFVPGQEYMIVKIMAQDPYELRMDHRLGEVVPTHDGRGAVIWRMEVTMRPFSRVRELKTDNEVYEAMSANLPVLGRTTYQSDDGATEVISEYPVTVMNGRHADHRWQVDTGPVLMPDFTLKPRLPVGLFRQAFLVYNTWDWVEAATRLPSAVDKSGAIVMHYTAPRRIAARNQLFAADV